MWYFLKRFILITRAALATLWGLFVYKRWPEPAAARETLESLGGIFVKLGQLLALRPDHIPERYTREFLRLLDRTTPVSFEDVETVLREELGARAEEIFASFEPEPLASASLGQVHKAVLVTGETVAVKIQRPNIRRAIRFDLALLSGLARVIDAVDPFWAAGALIGQLKRWSLREIDFRQEAKVADYFYQRRTEFPGARFPKVFWAFSTRRVLTAEFIPGTTFSGLKERNVEAPRRRLAELLFHQQLKAYFIEGIYHGDPHPSNLILTPEGEIAYVDFGIFGEVPLEERKRFGEFLYAVVRHDADASLAGLLDLVQLATGVHPNDFFSYLWQSSLQFRGVVPQLRRAFHDQLFKELEPLLNAWHGSFADSGGVNRNSADFGVKVAMVAARYGLQMPHLSLFFRTLMIMQSVVEGSLGIVINVAQVTSQFFEEHIEAIRALPEPLLAAEPQDPRLAEAWQVRQELLQERREIERETFFERMFFALEKLVTENES